MRLLNVETLEFGEFSEQDTPLYCILSHRWATQEVSYRDFLLDRTIYRRHTDTAPAEWSLSPGFKKVVDLCAFARRRQIVWNEGESPNLTSLQWVWIDTCCTILKVD